MSLTVVSGPMFAGKSTWIQNYVNRHDKIGLTGLVLRPELSARFSKETSGLMTTHDEASTIQCLEIPDGQSIVRFLQQSGLRDSLASGSIGFVIIDEAQFCIGLLDAIDYIVDRFGTDLVLVGLSSDFRRQPFYDPRSKQPEFLVAVGLAEHHIKLHALCTYCRNGSPGIYTQRKVSNSQVVLVGSADLYESVCRKHYKRTSSEAHV